MLERLRRAARPSMAYCALPLMILSIAACGGQTAKEVAYGTLKQANAYEKEVDRKIAAESSFYKRQLSNLRAFLIGAMLPEEKPTASTDKATPSVSKSGSIESSWLWGYIRTTTDNSAMRAANRLLNKPQELPYGVILDLVEDGLRTNREALAEVRRKQAELTVTAAESLQPLEKQGQRLAALKKGLTDLTTSKGNIVNLDDLLELAGSVLAEPDDASSP